MNRSEAISLTEYIMARADLAPECLAPLPSAGPARARRLRMDQLYSERHVARRLRAEAASHMEAALRHGDVGWIDSAHAALVDAEACLSSCEARLAQEVAS